MKKNKLFINCEEAKEICDKAQYGEATFWEKIKLTIRLSWCKVSKSYSKKNKQLTKVINTSEVDCLKQAERDALKAEFNQQLHQQK
ncbi:hypothetical protein [Lacinutrix undariae]